MVDDIEGAPPTRGGNRRRLITILTAAGVVMVLATGAAVAYGAAAEAKAAADLKAAQAEALAAAIRDAVLARGDAYAVAAEARAVSDAAGDLLSDDERGGLLTPIDELDEHTDTALSTRGFGEVVDYTNRFPSLVDAVQLALKDAVDTAIEAAASRLAADTLASTECRDAVTAAIEALDSVEPSPEFVAALLAAVDAADQSHKDAAAAAAGTPASGPGGGGSASGGSGGSGGTGGTAPGPGGPTTPPPPPPYTDADAVAAVSGAYGGQVGLSTGTCGSINFGTWSRNSIPTPPRLDLIPSGGWLAFKAWSIGVGGEVHYYACH